MWPRAVAAIALAAGALGCNALGSLPRPAGPRDASASAVEAAIEQQEICIGSSVRSVGKLGDVLYYRAAPIEGGRVAVGYFAFFSEERPWGNNWMTWTLLPAIWLDLVYSRGLFVGPGMQRMAHGKGDVEGIRVVYDVDPGGELRASHAWAENGRHRPVLLRREDFFAIDPVRPTFYSDVWSHQLGGRGVRDRRRLAYVRCYRGDQVRPLTASIEAEFDLARRAPPAHVEALAAALPRERRPRAVTRWASFR